MRVLDKSDLLAPEIAGARARLEARIEDDLLVYDILGLADVTSLYYFKKDDAYQSEPAICLEGLPPDEVMVNDELAYHVVAENSARSPWTDANRLADAIHVTLPFAVNPDRDRVKLLGTNTIERFVFERHPVYFDSNHQKFLDKKIAERRSRHRHAPLPRNRLVLSQQLDAMLPHDRLAASDGKPVALVAMHWLDTGGAESCAVEAVEAAKAAGYFVICITDVRGKEPLEARVRQSADHLFCLDRTLPRQYFQRFVLSLFARYRIDILHIHHCLTAYQCLPRIKAYFPDVKVISSTHIIEHRDGGYCRIGGVFTNYIDVHHVISQEVKDYYENEFGIEPRKICLGYLIDPDASDAQARRITHDDVKGHCKVLFVGRMVQQKRPHLLVGLAQRLKRRKVSFSISVIGTGPYLDHVKKFAERRGVSGQIDFLGALNHDDVLEQMAQHHLLVIPSENEGLTLVGLEAGMFGLGIVSSDVGSQCEIVADEMLVPRATMRCLDGMAGKIQQFVSDRDFFEKVMASQQAKRQALLSAPKYVDLLRDVFKLPEDATA